MCILFICLLKIRKDGNKIDIWLLYFFYCNLSVGIQLIVYVFGYYFIIHQWVKLLSRKMNKLCYEIHNSNQLCYRKHRKYYNLNKLFNYIRFPIYLWWVTGLIPSSWLKLDIQSKTFANWTHQTSFRLLLWTGLYLKNHISK